jgi:hypothetical protein
MHRHYHVCLPHQGDPICKGFDLRIGGIDQIDAFGCSKLHLDLHPQDRDQWCRHRRSDGHTPLVRLGLLEENDGCIHAGILASDRARGWVAHRIGLAPDLQLPCQ